MRIHAALLSSITIWAMFGCIVPATTQLPIGNFALPASQQPGPLFSLGQNVVDKGDILLYSYIDYLRGHDNKKFTEIAPSLLYGITDQLSLFIEGSFAANYTLGCEHSAGVEDTLIELEWAVYDKGNEKRARQVTLIVDCILPTGSAYKEPNTGFGACAIFFGGTAVHMTHQWYFFLSGGILAPLDHCGTQAGNRYLYQGGMGANIAYTRDWIWTAIVEFNGIYAQRSKFCGVINPDSGGSGFSIGPSLWFSTKNLILQVGVSVPVAQHLFGNQPKNDYFFAVNMGWKFNA